MNQKLMAVGFGVTQQHFNAVVKGRKDAGKELAGKIVKMIGGNTDVWLYQSGRITRKQIIDSYLAAFRKAHKGN